MGWIEGLNASVDYIEEHLDGDVDIARAASFASCTEGQFRRIFSYLAGMGLAEYVRKRRLSCAALDLSRGERVLDVAVRYGYSSPTAFNRAFQEVLGMSPSEARCPGAPLLVFPRCTFALTVTGAEPLPWRVVTQQGMRLVGISASCGTARGNPLVQMSSSGRESLSNLWKRASQDGVIERLVALADGSGPQGILGVNVCKDDDGQSYQIAVASSREAPVWADEMHVPSGLWAVFDCMGPCDTATAECYRRIYSEWLPSSGYKLSGDVSIEVYPQGDFSSTSYRSEIWMPISKRFNA